MGAQLDAPLRQPVAVHALSDPPAELRAHTLALCDAVREAEERHFPAWCRVVENRHRRSPRKLPPETVEAERELLGVLAAAVGTLRQHCEADVAAAVRECHALMRAQIEGELTLAAALRVTPAGVARSQLNERAIERRRVLFETRDALCCGRGWPHCGEIVIATAWIYSEGAPGGRFVHDGDAVYTGAGDICNVSHTVRVAGLEINRGTLHVTWEPHVRWGNADPDGDIAMRVASRPTQPLPCPLPRWPKESDVGHIDERSRVAVGEQIALL